jgi:hypothetical protein
MRPAITGLLILGLLFPGVTLADAAAAAAGAPATDPFDYSALQVNRLQAHSDYFADTSSGDGLLLSYDSGEYVYVYGQWDHLKFKTLPGSHNVYGVGVGAHQAYNTSTSFFIDAAFMKDQLSGSLGGQADDYWRVDYGFRNHPTDLVEFDGSIFTERGTVFGRRPFSERLGLGLDFSVISVMAAAEHTADGNRTEITLSWNY